MSFGPAECPYCGSIMKPVYYAISGGVVFCELEGPVADLVSGRSPAQAAGDANSIDGKDRRLHVVLSRMSYTRAGEWPKPGHYCFGCGSIHVRLKTAKTKS